MQSGQLACASVCFLLGVGAIPLALRAQGSPPSGDIQLDVKEAELPNGLKVLMVEDHSAPVVSFQVWVRVGSKNERPGITGISHLFEHMMFKGSKKYGPEEHARIVQSNGGTLNAFTTWDSTVYFENFPSEKLPLAMQLESERFMNLAITDETLKTEREVVKEERRFRTDNTPIGRALEEFMAVAFKAHPYGWPVVGWMTDLDAITLQDCKDYFRTHYAPNNAIVVIAGDFVPADAEAQVRRYFGKWKRQPPPPPVVTMEPPQKGERRVTLKAPVQNPMLLGGFHIGDYTNADLPALEVLSQILSDGKSSRLYRKLVYEDQTALSAEGAVLKMQHPGVFYAYASVKPGEDPRKVEDAFFKELDRFKTEPVSDRELQKAQNGLESGFVFSLKRVYSLGMSVGEAQLMGGDWRLVNQRLSRYRAVTKEDLMRVAQTYFTVDNRTLVTLVPEKSVEPSAAPAPKAPAAPPARQPR
ncbi:MAG: pitrilysin family protein [Myxococcota bacterium]